MQHIVAKYMSLPCRNAEAGDSDASVYRQLIENPSEAHWLAELRDVVAGKYDNAIRHLGSADVHVREVLSTYIHNGADAENAARALFSAAAKLFKELDLPDAASPEAPYKVKRILELAEAFPSQTATAKVVELFQNPKLLADGRRLGGNVDLRRDALSALEADYPIAVVSREARNAAIISTLQKAEVDEALIGYVQSIMAAEAQRGKPPTIKGRG